ncbi:zinc-finger protein [Clarireedia jacksonii]
MRHASLPENDSKQQESIPYHDYEVFYPTRIQTSVANCTSDTRYPNRYQYTPTFATTEIFGDEEFVGTVQALAHLNPQPYQQPFLYETMDLSPRLAQNQNRDGRTMRGKSLANPAWSNSNNKGQPARKRQRYDDADSSLRRPVSGIGRVGYSTQSEAPSECCSSCPSGTVCTEPDCDVQKDIVVTCTSPQCEEPVCTEPCLRGAVGGRRCSLSEESLGSGDEFSCWENTAWTSQESRPVAAPGAPHLPSSSHQGFESKHETPQEVVPSSVPTTPSLAMNMETPYSDQAAFHTPQSSGYTMSQPENISGTSLHGAGMRFGDDLQMFSCNWLDCGQPMQDQFEWHRHFHQEHIDPQFTFNCPMPSDSCQVPLNSNPIDHLQLTHGFTFHETANGFACPAPNCLTDEMYCDPSMLHNHLDQMHAIPVQGELQCQVDHCNTLYQDPHQFFNHLNSEHNLPIPMTPIEEIELPSAPTPAVKENVEQPEHDNHLSCKWTTGNDHLCGEVFNSEEELQLHVKKAHLSSLNKQSGYFCKWQGCGRKQKMGDKEGFSQRGKLERHMASHTGCKFTL